MRICRIAELDDKADDGFIAPLNRFNAPPNALTPSLAGAKQDISDRSACEVSLNPLQHSHGSGDSAALSYTQRRILSQHQRGGGEWRLTGGGNAGDACVNSD